MMSEIIKAKVNGLICPKCSKPIPAEAVRVWSVEARIEITCQSCHHVAVTIELEDEEYGC